MPSLCDQGGSLTDSVRAADLRLNDQVHRAGASPVEKPGAPVAPAPVQPLVRSQGVTSAVACSGRRCVAYTPRQQDDSLLDEHPDATILADSNSPPWFKEKPFSCSHRPVRWVHRGHALRIYPTTLHWAVQYQPQSFDADIKAATRPHRSLSRRAQDQHCLRAGLPVPEPKCLFLAAEPPSDQSSSSLSLRPSRP